MNSLDRLERTSSVTHAALIALLGLCLLLLVFQAPFLNYDDPGHIYDNKLVVGDPALGDFFVPQHDYKWFPVTSLSYRLDYMLFHGTLPGIFGTWAPGVRFMNYVYHTGAAILLWRLLLLLGLAPLPALFGGIFFVAHPMACETVCWASERKTALAGLFGFGALWAWVRLERSLWRIPTATALFVLALLSKASALGLLPVFVLLELFGGAGRIRGDSASPAPLLSRLLPMTPLVAVAVVAIAGNLILHDGVIVPHPGGSLFTALLTDVPILNRYLYNALLPAALSFAYYIEPVTTVLSARFILHSLLFLLAVAFTLKLAPNRRRAFFGWLWLLAALGPTLNIVAISNLFQDRFFYLSVPGFLLVLTELAAGLRARFNLSPRNLRAAATAYVLLLAFSAILRGALFTNLLDVFGDAVAKQPQSSHARQALSMAYVDEIAVLMQQKGWRDDPLQRGRIDEMLQQMRAQKFAFFECPDAERQLNFTPVALDAGDYCLERNDIAQAETFWRSAAAGPSHLRVFPAIRSQALCRLAEQRMKDGELDQAYTYAQQAVAADPTQKMPRLYRARLSMDLAVRSWKNSANGPRAQALLAFARRDLEAVANRPCALVEQLQKQLLNAEEHTR